jgi:hypothetical protein
MPHIVVSAIDTTRIIQEVQIDTRVHFQKEFYLGNENRCRQKLQELHAKLEAVVCEYFDGNYEADHWLHNHSYNQESGQV